MTSRGRDGTEEGSSLESTATLLSLAREGDGSARERLLERYLPILRRWARGRLPTGARDLLDTDDLVQVSLLRALNHMEAFEPRWEGAFLAYLRRIVLNAVRDEIRRVARKPTSEPLEMELPAKAPSHLEQAIGREAVEAYEEALLALPEEQQQAVILRIEFGYSYPEIAEALDRPSANAARMMVSRALVRLAEVMGERGI
jgi:RNA polymerase sigma-70 factor (ECF subfamily)